MIAFAFALTLFAFEYVIPAIVNDFSFSDNFFLFASFSLSL